MLVKYAHGPTSKLVFAKCQKTSAYTAYWMVQKRLKNYEIQEFLFEDISDRDTFYGGDSDDEEECVITLIISPCNSPLQAEEKDDVPLSRLAPIVAISEHAIYSSTLRSDNDIPKW
ncbi:hypothetical protein EVAR_91620_1 [Eumeta japonica]|uniref:Uncharacterized protein n=1 Tax=Eumeta variegata TaxID=151549 RepID=A0A4C1UX72_EUMVA|nr:hypothetical protein EVAR_91620_1 [Eumeta japonica]